jgi:hypothetical protein
LYFQVQGVDEHSNLERIISDANDEQVNELLVSDLILSVGRELFNVIFLAVHLKHNVNIISSDQEFFSVVLSYSLLDRSTGDHYLFVVSLVVLPVS